VARTPPIDEDFVLRRTTEATLRDGTRVRLRPIIPDDKGHLVEGFRRLSPESRYRRFLAPVEELSEEQLVYLTEIDYHDHFAWIALSLHEAGTPGIAVARYVRGGEDPHVAEAAVTVIDDYHGRGLGTLLLEMLGAVALANGVRTFRGYALEDNRAILDVLKGLDARTHHDSPGVIRVEIDLPARAENLRGSPLYEVLRAVARGDGPVFLPPESLSPRAPLDGTA
jgi:GNAT superfamily N-acetyltransferase